MKQFRKPTLIIAGLVAFYALAGFVVIPKLLQSKLPELIETETGRKASLDTIDFNPFSLELSLQGFSMQEKDVQTFVTFGELFVNIQMWASLKNLALVIDEVSLTEPYVRIESVAEGQYNFSDLLKGSQDEPPVDEEDGDIFPLIINQISLIKGEVEVVDSRYAKPVTSLIQDLNLQLEHVSTVLGDDSTMGFSMVLNSGGTIQWQGEFGINPLFSTGRVALEGIKFAKVWEVFLQDRVGFKWTGGTQLIKFNYAFSYPDNEPVFKLTDGHLLTENLKFTAKDNTQKIIELPFFSIEGITFDLNSQSINITKIESRDAGFEVGFNQSGVLNYQAVFAGQGNEQDTASTKDEQVEAITHPWEINVQDIALNTSTINFTDKQPADAVLINIAALNMGLKNYRLLVGESLQMTANQGAIQLQDFTLKTDQQPPLVKVANLQVNELDFDLREKNISIKSVSSRDATIKAWLAKNGEINYQSLFASAAKEQGQPQAESPVANDNNEPPWKIALQEFKIDNYALEFTDHTPEKPVALNLAALNFTITDYNNQQGTSFPLSFSTQLNQSGRLKISGDSILEPFSADLQLAVSRVGIHSFQPYINQSARLDVIGGELNTEGQLVISQAAQGELQLNYKGGLEVKGLHTRDHILKQDFLKWQLLKLNGLDFNLQPTQLNIKSIHLDKPYSRFTIKEDKTTNINDVLISVEQAEKPATAEKSEASSMMYNIAKVKITGGEADFSDYSLILPFVVKLNALDGVIDNITSKAKAKTQVTLAGKAFDLAPVEIQGDFDAGFEDLDIAMNYKSLPLPLITPYMVEFSGDKIEKGKLTLDLMYKIKEGQLTATNNILIDQLELGEKVENPDAVSLPLGLAIALLKDKDGKININMPLKGSMDDPEFSIWPVVFDTFVNVIIKAAASPFSALGSLLGDNDEDFSVVTFQAGSTEITAEETAKLDSLVNALVQKSGLTLEIKGGAYTNQDWPAMKEQALEDQLKQIRSEELKKEGEIKLPEYIELSEDDYQRLLADLFIQQFPELGKRSIFGTPKLIHADMGEFYTIAGNMLQGMIKPDPHRLLDLSANRAKNIARYMLKAGDIEQSRIFILNGKVAQEADNNEISAHLSLTVQ